MQSAHNNKRNALKLLSLTVMISVLAGCGHTRTERTVSGGIIGAGVGALGSEFLGGDPATGAVVGGVVGAGAGVLTK